MGRYPLVRAFYSSSRLPSQSKLLHQLPAVAWQIIHYDDARGEGTECFVLSEWPTEAGRRIPNTISYSYDENGHLQWGYDISPKSPDTAQTRLHFDIEPREIELKSIIRTLDRIWDMDVDKLVENGCTPDFPPFDTVEIASDYLQNVRQWVCSSMERQFGPGYISNLATEIIYTIPAVSLVTPALAMCIEE